ncbi:arcelin-1-like [Punica granatum]|uniref:Arcelin-1-like n=1 Tax=Punica granatum TaxID=22663 RepID=A0A6P8DUF0_PUNGR|nr:arcelin-1-like [Punica granatum]
MSSSTPMAAASVSSTLLGLLTFLFLRVLSADPTTPSFSFSRFDRDPATISLLGDSELVNGGSAIELSGQAVYAEPIRVVGGNPQSLASFSTNFTFSLSRGSGDGFAFAMAPRGVSSSLSGNGRFGLPVGKNRSVDGFLVVEFDAVENRVGIDSGSRKVGNVSSLNLVLNSGHKLQCWIDYEAGSRRLEVRLSKLGGSKPLNPFLAHQVDLWKMWKDRDVFFGLSSSSGASNHSCLIHSWSFELRRPPHWIHSQPLDPNAISEDKNPLTGPRGKNDCLLKVLAAMIFGTGSGALGAFCILYLWTIFGRRRPVAPEEFVGKEKSLDCGYKKVEVVVVDKAIEGGH